MRILIVHNRYRSAQPSGENLAVDRQLELLTAAGHEVATYERSSDEIQHYGLGEKLLVPGRVVWSQRSRREVTRALEQHRPDVVHVHNTFPLISPSILEPCARASALVVTLHNYRLVCPEAQLFRDGSPCELCVGRVPWPSVVHGCYRGSRVSTAPLALAVGAHRATRVWTRHVPVLIALSEFARDRLIAGGLGPDQLAVLPNFSPRPQRRRLGPGSHFLFLGRLSPEKAPELVLEAWRPELGTLLVAGDGPLRQRVSSAAARHGDSVRVLGLQSPARAMELLADARALIVASRVYEACPLVIAEALACGVPVIAPAHGAFAEMVEDRSTGRLFAPGRAAELTTCLRELRDDATSIRMGRDAEIVYERRFSPQRHLEQLLEVYDRARRARSHRWPGP